MRLILIALPCALAAAGIFLALRGNDERPPALVQAPVRALAASDVAAIPPAVSAPAMPVQPRVTATSPARAASARVAQASSPEAPPRRTVFALSSDHRALLQQAPLASSDHDLLERESRDDAWASESEQLIRQELARQGAAADFDVVAVDCRQTLCAIEAFSYNQGDRREWVEAMDAAFKEAFGNAFSSMNTAFPTEGSRAPVMTFLHRKPSGTDAPSQSN
jgi:hypothetical protein